jgi:hypothetical protein
MPSHPFPVAVEARNLDAMIEALAPDVVFHSPLISAPFVGRDQVGGLFEILANEMLFKEDFRYTAEIRNPDTVVLKFQTRVKRTEVEGVDLLQLDDQDKVRDITVFLRPFPGVGAVAAVLAPRVAGRGNSAISGAASLATRLLSALTRLFDAVGSRSVKNRG